MPLEKYIPTSEEISDSVLFGDEDDGETLAKLLNNLKPNQYYVAETMSTSLDTRHFNKTIEKLKKRGLDIGRGESRYGFRMPLPEKGKHYRELIIFRRR